VVDGLRAAGAGDIPVIVGGIIPPDDAAKLRERGVARVFTPKDYELTEIMDEIVTVIREVRSLA
jgi:(2R)-ethylmalonyl-CoA mutase